MCPRGSECPLLNKTRMHLLFVRQFILFVYIHLYIYHTLICIPKLKSRDW